MRIASLAICCINILNICTVTVISPSPLSHPPSVQKDNGQLRDAFSSLEKEHESAITKLLTSHEERLTKMREHHVDLMASILHMNQDTPPTGGGGATAPSANKK